MRLCHLIPILLAAACGAPGERYTVGTAEASGGVGLIVLRDSSAGVEASIAPAKGGELSGLRVRMGDAWVETIYLADDYSPREGFSGKAPLLWPATGRSLPEDLQQPAQQVGGGDSAGSWDWDGNRYPMTGHGFARDFPWEAAEPAADGQNARVRLVFRENERTREMYPFGFEAAAGYVLAEGALEIAYRFEAAADNGGPMPFSIGNHIAFRTPLLEGSSADEMLFVTPSKEQLLKDGFGFPSGASRPRSHAEGIRLAAWEPRVPISLAGYGGDPWVSLEDPGGLTIRLSHRASRAPMTPYIQFNVWGAPLEGYFSPEPWLGMQNSLNSGQGLVHLAPGESFDWTIRIEFERQP